MTEMAFDVTVACTQRQTDQRGLRTRVDATHGAGVAVPPKQRRKRVTTASSRKNTTRDSSRVLGSDGDGILGVCRGHHVATTGKAGTVKVEEGTKSKVAGGGGTAALDAVAVLTWLATNGSYS